MTPKTDWERIKAQYITGDKSYRVLAAEWGVSHRTLGDHGKREGWPQLRQAYKDKRVGETVQKIGKRESAKAADQLLALKESAEKMSEVIVHIFDDAQQFYRHLVQEGDGGTFGTDERLFRKADTKAIKDLTSAMKDLAAVIRNVNDLPTAQESAAMKLAADRFALERKRAEEEEELRARGVEVIFQPLQGATPSESAASEEEAALVDTGEWSE